MACRRCIKLGIAWHADSGAHGNQIPSTPELEKCQEAGTVEELLLLLLQANWRQPLMDGPSHLVFRGNFASHCAGATFAVIVSLLANRQSSLSRLVERGFLQAAMKRNYYKWVAQARTSAGTDCLKRVCSSLFKLDDQMVAAILRALGRHCGWGN